MNQTEFAISMLTSIVIKEQKGIPLTELEIEYLSGVMEGFDGSSESEQEYILNYADTLEALATKQRGRLN